MTYSNSAARLLRPTIEPLEARIAPATVTGVLPLSSLDSAHGIKITSSGGGEAGFTVSSVGDVNGDGLPDFAVAAPSANNTGGEVFIVYGRPGLTAPGTLDLSSIESGDGSLGFAVRDNVPGFGNHSLGYSVQAAGDVNGDGVGDLIVSAPNDNQGGTAAGAAYVIFGHKGGLPPVINVFNASGLSDLNGTNGFKISGPSGGTNVGSSVSAGDVNGDGLSDLIIGAPGIFTGGAGAVYVVFGQHTFPAVLPLSSLTGTNGYTLTGEASGDQFGASVSVVGDVNHDGVNDFLIGAPGHNSGPGAANAGVGAAYFVKGFKSVPSSNLSITAVADFVVLGASAGDHLGASVHGAGDFNGDGVPDLLIGAPDVNNSTGAAYLLPGPAHGFVYAPSFSIAAVGKTTFTGEMAGDRFGASVSSAGDVNGDGFPDLIVGAPGASSAAGASYVFFGKSGGLTGTITPSSLTGVNGFKITGAAANDGSGASVSSILDVNGDGYSDLLVGAHGVGNYSGGAYVIYGGPSGLAVGPVAVHLFNGVGQFNDVDGDLVTVKLKTQIQAGNFDLLVKSIAGGSSSQLLGLQIGGDFEGSDLSITVKRGPVGDGKVNIGFIDAHGVDLGAVTVMGDLGKIVAGSGGTKLAFKSLTVDSLGDFGGTTEDTGSDHISTITGSAGPVKILGDLRAAEVNLLAGAAPGSGKLASLTIGGSLVGGSLASLAEVNAPAIGPVKIGGSLVGGSADYTAALNAGSFSTITIGGSLIGNSGFGSGNIYSGPGFGSNPTGAVGAVKIGGGLFGGSGASSGTVVGSSFGALAIGGGLLGGSGVSSGGVSGTTFGRVAIGGSLSGASGDYSGEFVGTTISTLAIGGSLLGSSGLRSGTLDVSYTGNIAIRGDQVGGLGSYSGSIFTGYDDGSIGKIFIGGSQIGGPGSNSGFIYAYSGNGSIAGVTIAGDALGGSARFSGGIFAAGKLGPVVIKGSVLGQDGHPYTIRGGGALSGPTSLAIASLTVGGNFEHALVLAGFKASNAPLNGHAQIGAITVGRDWIASSVLAGVQANDGFSFIGNGFDTLINAGASTAIASIASITIKGHAMGSPELGDHFGIEAEQIGAVSIGGVKLALLPGKANDTAGFALGPTPDFVVREIAPSAPM